MKQRKKIIKNAVNILNGMGYKRPKVAVLAAVEKANGSMPETLDGQSLQEECENGIIDYCDIEGPLSYDIAISKANAETKRYKGKNTGNYDIWLMPNISAGNILCKSPNMQCWS